MFTFAGTILFHRLCKHDTVYETYSEPDSSTKEYYVNKHTDNRNKLVKLKKDCYLEDIFWEFKNLYTVYIYCSAWKKIY